jgi:regulator of sigma E protease
MFILLGIICLSLVVFVHELGHFLAAKSVGIVVERFSIGMGPRLIGFTHKGTDYCISLLPIGGFCKMKGESSFGEEEDGKPALENKEPEPGSFYAVSPLKRIFVAFMGPAFNVLFSILALSIVWMHGWEVRSPGNKVILSSQYDKTLSLGLPDDMPIPHPADKAGLKTGDEILSVMGKKIDYYFQIQEVVARNPDKPIALSYRRDGNTYTTTVTPFLNRKSAIGQIGVYAWTDPVVDTVEPGSPAARAGLQKGDLITAVNGQAVNCSMDLEGLLAGKPKNLSLSLLRAGTAVELSFEPEYRAKGETYLGFNFLYLTYRSPKVSILGALGHGSVESFTNLFDSVRSLGLLFRNIDVTQSLAGPARIVYLVGDTAKSSFSVSLGTGLTAMLRLLSFISVALFFTNLLPIPLLDGGLIVMFLIELFRKKRVSPKTMYRYALVGLFIVLGIFLFSMFNDIFFFATK